MPTAIIGLLITITIVSVWGILAGRASHLQNGKKRARIGYAGATQKHEPDLNRDNPDAMRLAEGGAAKNQFPASGARG